MKVIALTGGIDSGKSHTINVAYYFLLRDGYTQVPGHFRILGNPKFKDIFDILEKAGKAIGIIGMGDYPIGKPDSLADLLNDMALRNCDAVICACRNTTKIEAAVKAYPHHILVPKTPSSGRANDRIVNTQDAITLINHL